MGTGDQGLRNHAVAGEVLPRQPSAYRAQFLGALHLLGEFLDQLLGLCALGPKDEREDGGFHDSFSYLSNKLRQICLTLGACALTETCDIATLTVL